MNCILEGLKIPFITNLVLVTLKVKAEVVNQALKKNILKNLSIRTLETMLHLDYSTEWISSLFAAQKS